MSLYEPHHSEFAKRYWFIRYNYISHIIYIDNKKCSNAIFFRVVNCIIPYGILLKTYLHGRLANALSITLRITPQTNGSLFLLVLLKTQQAIL